MDTIRSQRMAKAFLARKQPFRRKIQVYERRLDAEAELVFPQLCPTREVDWIDGWEADLIWTTTGYAEPDCIFTTPPNAMFGGSLWVFTRLEPNRLLEAVRIIENNVVEHLKIELEDNGDGTCASTWTLKFTALNEAGNAFVDALPEHDQAFEGILNGFDHFLAHGERLSAAHR